MNHNLLDIKETAKYLHISVSTLYRWIHQKKIQYSKIGSRVLFTKESLEIFIQNNTITPN